MPVPALLDRIAVTTTNTRLLLNTVANVSYYCNYARLDDVKAFIERPKTIIRSATSIRLRTWFLFLFVADNSATIRATQGRSVAVRSSRSRSVWPYADAQDRANSWMNAGRLRRRASTAEP